MLFTSFFAGGIINQIRSCLSVLEILSYNYLRQTHMGLPLNIFRLASYWLWHVIRDVKT